MPLLWKVRGNEREGVSDLVVNDLRSIKVFTFAYDFPL